jgi:putative toxin-antitoxin system antitoxin component (TIGR02293 family)
MATVAKKKIAVRKKRSPVVIAKERKPVVRNIIGNIEKWTVDKKIAVIESGVSKLEFEALKKEMGLDYETLSHILSVTKATLHNKKGNGKFNAMVSERLLMFVEIYVYGIEVFGSKEKFSHWISNPIRSTGGIAPMKLLYTFYCMEEVKRIIGRIDYGVYS